MAQIPGVNIELPLFKLNHIRDAWSDYIWSCAFCHDSIRFTEEEKTNYIADLLAYLDDTVYLLSNFRTNENYRSALYDTFAVLQLMYVQQDLIDELFGLFIIPIDRSEKNGIREIRNELVGHPISRKKGKGGRGKLKSSVFVTGQTQGENLQYARYHHENGFSFELITYDWKDIFSKHQSFLNGSFDKILTKIDQMLSALKIALQQLQSSIEQADFIDLVNNVNHVYATYNKNFPPYSMNNILYCYSHKGQHPRYDYTLKLYLEGLPISINEKISRIDEFLLREFKPAKNVKNTHAIEFESGVDGLVNFVVHGDKSEKLKGRDLHYAFSKLFNEGHPFGLSYFKREFQNDSEVLSELENMNQISSVEFYISIEYLRMLLQQRGVLT